LWQWYNRIFCNRCSSVKQAVKVKRHFEAH
jgi:hypothetical protein